MARETKATRAERAERIVEALFSAHPDAHCALDHRNPFELLVATILSAQCTDKMVNTVTPELFARYGDAAAMAAANDADLQTMIRSTGFYRNKARSLLGMSGALVERHGGVVPRSLEELVRLPGVGRKTANVILGNAFDVPGLVVDTHVGRIARRLGLTRAEDAVRVEQDLMKLVPKRQWTMFSHAMIFHGRRICSSRKPACDGCPLRPECPTPAAAPR